VIVARVTCGHEKSAFGGTKERTNERCGVDTNVYAVNAASVRRPAAICRPVALAAEVSVAAMSAAVSGLDRPTSERHSAPAPPIARHHGGLWCSRDFLGAISQERPCIKARGPNSVTCLE
jgi:hypothetical protein